jgi:hypothetical protein
MQISRGQKEMLAHSPGRNGLEFIMFKKACIIIFKRIKRGRRDLGEKKKLGKYIIKSVILARSL